MSEQHSLQTYVSDMAALENHVRVPFETQLHDDDFARYDGAREIIAELSQMSDRHINALNDALDRLGGHEASPLKSAVAGFEGFFAGAIDKMRKTKVSKALRDDYTALSLASAGYTMLQTTALAMGDTAVASLAEQHLRDYAECIMRIAQALPTVVLLELQEIGLSVDTSMAGPAQRASQEAWRSSAESVHGSASS